MHFLKRFFRQRRRSVHEQVASVAGFWKSDHFADVWLIGEYSDQTINAEPDAAMRWSAEGKRLEHMSKLFFNSLLIQTHDFKNFMERFGAMVTDTTAADFKTVQGNIVLRG